MTRLEQLFTKNKGLRKIVRPCMEANACLMPEGQGSWQPYDKRAGDRNYNGPKVAKFLVG